MSPETEEKLAKFLPWVLRNMRTILYAALACSLAWTAIGILQAPAGRFPVGSCVGDTHTKRIQRIIRAPLGGRAGITAEIVELGRDSHTTDQVGQRVPFFDNANQLAIECPPEPLNDPNALKEPVVVNHP